MLLQGISEENYLLQYFSSKVYMLARVTKSLTDRSHTGFFTCITDHHLRFICLCVNENDVENRVFKTLQVSITAISPDVIDTMQLEILLY